VLLLPDRREIAVCRAELLAVLAMKMLMEMDLDTEVELSPVAKAEATMCSPYPSPSTAVLLKRRVVAWCVCLSLASTEYSLFAVSSD
jgi:hypothetical protein